MGRQNNFSPLIIVTALLVLLVGLGKDFAPLILLLGLWLLWRSLENWQRENCGKPLFMSPGGSCCCGSVSRRDGGKMDLKPNAKPCSPISRQQDHSKESRSTDVEFWSCGSELGRLEDIVDNGEVNVDVTYSSKKSDWYRLFGSKSDCRHISGELFKVRTVGYKQSGVKKPSACECYDLLGTDCVNGDGARINRVVERWPEKFKQLVKDNKSNDWDAKWGIPEFLILVQETPLESGGLWGSPPDDDWGNTIMGYFKLNSRSKQILKSGAMSPQLKLWKKVCDMRESTKKVSFKAIGMAANIDDLPVPSMLKGYNGKPALITGSGKFHDKMMPQVIEVDYDLRLWSYFARQSITSYIDMFPKVELQLGYLVEGKTDDELPEQMLACVEMRYPDLRNGLKVKPPRLTGSK